MNKVLRMQQRLLQAYQTMLLLCWAIWFVWYTGKLYCRIGGFGC